MSLASSDYIFTNKKGGVQVHADLAFVRIYPTLSPDTPIDEVSKKIREKVIADSKEKYAGKEPTSGSLNNCSGRWNELAFLIAAHISVLEKKDTIYVVRMGNEASIKFWEVYTEESRKNFQNLLTRLAQKNISLRCSAPDFIVVNREVVKGLVPQLSSTEISLQQMSLIQGLYEYLKGKCKPADVKSFISIKTSNRPDRRYQILYEATITKYASKHIHDCNHPLRFDIIGNSTPEDTDVFSAPEILTLPHIFPFQNLELGEVKKLIDSDERITTKEELDMYWDRYPEK